MKISNGHQHYQQQNHWEDNQSVSHDKIMIKDDDK